MFIVVPNLQNSEAYNDVYKAESTYHANTHSQYGKSLYDRLGGIYSIAAVVDRFSDKIIDNPIVGVNSPNPYLREWSNNKSPTRLPGLKWMRTLWVASLAGGPYTYIGTHNNQKDDYDITNAHSSLHITSEEFDEVAKELVSAMQYYNSAWGREQDEVINVFYEHKKDVVNGNC